MLHTWFLHSLQRTEGEGEGRGEGEEGEGEVEGKEERRERECECDKDLKAGGRRHCIITTNPDDCYQNRCLRSDFVAL